jgi:transposase
LRPQIFCRSKTVGAHFGLTPRRIQSGDSIDFNRHISGNGDAEVCATLHEAAHVLLTKGRTHSGLKAWGLRVANDAAISARPSRSPASWR